MKDKKNKIMILAITFALVVVFSGVTYAYFTSAVSSESGSTIVAKGGTMNIVYDNKSANIEVSNVYPRNDAWVTKKFQVIGNNTTDLIMFYKVKMVVDNNEFAVDLSYTLTGTNTDNSGALIPDITTNARIGKDDVTLGTGYHTKGTNKVHDYTLKIFLKPAEYNQNYAQEANFAAHLVIEVDGTSTESAPKNWDNAGSNTLLAGIKKNYASPTATLTNPITDASTGTEAEMSLAPDDYGISYYFRGNVQNNFVSFAGMCWRIVRITGDGSIKLTLYDYSSASCTNTGDTLAFARYDGETFTTKFNEKSDDNAYVGFMYGTPNSNTYAATHANINKSAILTNLEAWYNAKLTAYESKLADTIWCNDKSTFKDANGIEYTNKNGVITKKSYNYSGLGYQKEASMYGARMRDNGLDGVSITYGSTSYPLGTGPSLICPKDNDGGKLSKFTVSDTTYGNGDLDKKIGLLTYDEAVLAGLPTVSAYEENGYNANSSVSYLKENANGNKYWLLTPYVYYFIPFIHTVDTTSYVNASGSASALRPAISLKSDVTISSGNGTASSPFVIN